MIEQRLTSVILLDGSQLDFLITPEFLTCDLADMVSSNLALYDKDYFGLSFIDSTGHRNWLQLDKKILDHDLPKKTGVLVLFFTVKFYIESIAYTKDKVAVELFFLQARLLIYQGDLEINNELICELGALVLQALFGDFKSDKETIQHIKSQNILPKHFIANYNQISSFCEPKIIAHYKKCSSLTRGQSIVNYLSIIEKLCNYGVHYYEVKDKTNTKWYLGISYRGIGLYEANNKIIPKKIFPWSKLENLYYRDKKFSIEVHENTTSSLSSLTNGVHHHHSHHNLSTSSASHTHSHTLNHNHNHNHNHHANTLTHDSPPHLNHHAGMTANSTINSNSNQDAFNPVKVYAWFAAIPSLCKSIWLMAVAQHQFYLDKKQNRHSLLQFKSLNDLATELDNNSINKSSLSLDNVDELNQTNSSTNKMKPQISLNGIFAENLSTKNNVVNGSNGDTTAVTQQQQQQSNGIKTEILNLYKKQKELLVKNIDLKKKQYEEIKNKQLEIQEIVKAMLVDRSQVENLLRALNEYKNLSNNGTSNGGMSTDLVDQDEDFAASKNSTSSLRLKKENYSTAYLDNLYVESEIKKKIMFISLNLASDPTVSYFVQKQRRDFYEKTKKKLTKLEKKIELELLRKNGENMSMLSSNTNQSSSQISNDKNPSFIQFNNGNNNGNVNGNNETKYSQFDENSTDISPASIHRKDSYRRAQEQKLFLESNCGQANKQNRFLAARKVKNLLNTNDFNHQNQTQQHQQPHPIDRSASTNTVNSTSTATQSLNVNNQNHMNSTSSNSSSSCSGSGSSSSRLISNMSSQNDLLSRKNFIPEESYKDGILVEMKQTSALNTPVLSSPTFSNNHLLIENDTYKSSSLLNGNNNNNGHNHLDESPSAYYDNNSQPYQNQPVPANRMFHLNDNFLDFESNKTHASFMPNGNPATSNVQYSSRSKLLNHYSNSVIANLPPGASNGLEPHYINNENVNMNRGGGGGGGGNMINFNQRKCAQRKNTSDSNMKLLADHNFYHVTNRRHHNANNNNHYMNSHNQNGFSANNNNSNSSSSNENYAFSENANEPLVNGNGMDAQLLNNLSINRMNKDSAKLIQKSYELSDYFKYNSKYKRGLNSSSNSLISLNSSSVGTNEDSNNNSEKDLIRSNPDLKMISSPNGYGYIKEMTPAHGTSNKMLNNLQHQTSNGHLTIVQSQPSPLSIQPNNVTQLMSNNNSNNYDNNHSPNLSSNTKNNNNNNLSGTFYKTSTSTDTNGTTINNLSNNLSLNLSIHTAEEFGIEMLEWLNNEQNKNVLITNNGGYLDFDESKLATNATLV